MVVLIQHPRQLSSVTPAALDLDTVTGIVPTEVIVRDCLRNMSMDEHETGARLSTNPYNMRD